MKEEFAQLYVAYLRQLRASGLDEASCMIAFAEALTLELDDFRSAAYAAIGYGDDDEEVS